MDTKQWAELEALHAPGHRSSNPSGTWTTAAEMVANIRRNMEYKTIVHHSHTAEITLAASTEATGVWAISSVSTWLHGAVAHLLYSAGHCFEEYEKRDGRWIFTSRRQQFHVTLMSPGAISPYPNPI
jgi:hypothetical protein